MKKKLNKKIVITREEHDRWHKKHKGYDTKNKKEHDLCHKKMGIIIKKSKKK